MQTSIAASIADDPQRRQLDHQCKVVLSHKAILARILKHTVSEVAGMDTEEIIAAIEGGTPAGRDACPGHIGEDRRE